MWKMRFAITVAALLFSALVRANVTVVEYYNSAFGHYFITPDVGEIAILDTRVPPFQDWSRTGYSFVAYESGAAPAGSVSICRFFNSSFAPKSSHFYAPKGLGCEQTLASFPDWHMENDNLFKAMLPNAGGACPGATVPIHRMYNNGLTGAPNHRFVTTLAERQVMLDRGHVSEGVGMCVVSVAYAPPPSGNGTAEGFWAGTTSQGNSVHLLVLDDRRFYLVFTGAGATADVGAVYGTGTSANGAFSSADGVTYTFAPGFPLYGGGAVPLNGTYVAGSTLQLSNGSNVLNATYDVGYQHQATFASMAGNYKMKVGHVTEEYSATAVMDASGHMSISGLQCDFQVALTPRGSVNVFNANVTLSRGQCFNGPAILYFDAANAKIYVMAQFSNRLLHIQDFWRAIGTRQ
jgi:hypothetical protein